MEGKCLYLLSNRALWILKICVLRGMGGNTLLIVFSDASEGRNYSILQMEALSIQSQTENYLFLKYTCE